MSTQKPIGNFTYDQTILIDGVTGMPYSSSNPVPVTGGGGADILLTDNTHVLFIAKDIGATTPSISYYLLSTGAVYVPIGTIRPAEANVLALESGGNLATMVTETGSLTETTPTTDTASSGLNGRLQRIAQRLTSLIALLPSSLGQKTSANSLAVTVASDQSTLSIKQVPFSATYTFTRPANTTTYVIGYALSNATSSPTQVSFTCGAANQSAIVEQITITSSRVGSPLAQIESWFGGTSFASATFNDGVALDIDSTTFITSPSAIALVETTSVNSRAKMTATNLNIPVTLDASGNLYMILKMLNAYIPGNAESFTCVVRGVLR